MCSMRTMAASFGDRGSPHAHGPRAGTSTPAARCLLFILLTEGGFDWSWVANLVTWLVIFSAGATRRSRKDTARV